MSLKAAFVSAPGNNLFNVEIVFFNGRFIPKEEVTISPDDRGFLFADGIYEVVRWYGKAFFDMDGHMNRLRRSLNELNIRWNETDMFPTAAEELVMRNNLGNSPAMVYLQVTRGVAKRTHYFPAPETVPTVYSYAFGFSPDEVSYKNGIKVLVRDDIRWSRCDIKSIALLPNTLCFQDAWSKGMKECIFVRNGLVTEGAHSNIFFVKNGTLYTHPDSDFILSGITRKNTLRVATENRIPVNETAVSLNEISQFQESFITNTSAEITPVIEMGGKIIGSGQPGPVTRILQERLSAETSALKS